MERIGNVSDLVQKAQDACKRGDRLNAKRFALEAIAGANIAKEKFLTDVHSSVTDQQLADWYGGCSYVMNQIEENLSATRCFYTAIVFDPSWTLQNHVAVSEKLWASLVYNREINELILNSKNILAFLDYMDKLARIAERRQKWGVCVAIDGDINKMLNFLKLFNIVTDIVKHPGRRQAMFRTARCYLNLNMHDDVRYLCSIILQHLCDYDDPEALEIWARSLFNTGVYDLAFEKNALAMKYCQDSGDRKRLEEFQSQIKSKLEDSVSSQREPDESWLEGTNYMSAASSRSPSPSPQKKTKRHRRPKAIDRSRQSTSSPRAQSVEPRSNAENIPPSTTATLYSRIPDTKKTLASAVERLKQEVTAVSRPRTVSGRSTTLSERSRNVSGSSVATAATDASIRTNTTEYSISESDSENSDDDSQDSSSRTDSPYAPEVHVEPNIDPEAEAMQEEMTFYEQSCRFHQQSVDEADDIGRSETDEKLLKFGIQLNMSFLSQFEDRHPDIMKRDPFYADFLDKEELRQKLLQNPKKYIRCVIQIEGSHEAYCHPVDTESGATVIEISGRSKIGQAFNEDEVVVELLDDQHARDKRYGKVLGIWNRQKNTEHPVFVCTLDTIESHLVRPMCKTIPKIHVLNREIMKKFTSEKSRRFKIEVYEYDERVGILCNPKIYSVNPAEAGSCILLVAFIKWSSRHIYPRGAIIKMLPCGKSIPTGLMILNLQHEVPALYKKETVEQVESMVKRFGDEPPESILKDREDLTAMNIFTIDPPGCKDVDDALSVEKTDVGYKVGVHIADVSVYIPKGSHLDEESKQRATTFYPGIRKPRHMIPEPFSSSICSLLQNKTRLTISIFFHIGSNGRPLQMEGSNFEIVKSFIRSRRQLTYGEAQTMIFAVPSEDNDAITKDVQCLFKLARKIRKIRLGNAMFALGLDWEESRNDELESETVEAHYLVEEFMVMANKKIAERLLRSYPNCIPLRCQPPPSQENIDAFFKKNDHYVNLLLRLQDRQIGPIRPNVDECLKEETNRSVMISKSVWEAIAGSPKTSGKYLKTDDLHPLQLAVYQHWLAIQEKAGYRCSGSLVGEEDGKHHSLDMFPYTHFTSPIRRYNDLVVHRLIHAAVFQRSASPYTKEEMDSICIHITSQAKRAKAYERGCRSLQQAVNLQEKPQMINCYVDEITDRGITLCSPVLKYVTKQNRELTFNLLDMGYKPEVFTDPETTWDKVKAVWRKRVYNFHVQPNTPADRGYVWELNPHKGLVFLPLHHWAKMLKCSVDERIDDLTGVIKRAKAHITARASGHDDVSTECLDPMKIQPSTKFSMTYSRGQQVQIQMSAGVYKGVIAPKPMLYNMTNNVKFCLQHTDDPVLYLYHYVTRSTCDQYKTVKEYLERWLPIMLMESATGIIRNEESCCISDVTVRLSGDNKGKFALGLAECEVRNIELSGTLSDDEDEEEDGASGSASSYDWLCLKTSLPNPSNQITNKKDLMQLDNNMWVGHAEVTKVKKNKDAPPSGKLTVSFSLHEKAPPFPPNFHQTSATPKFSVEILRKSEVDRRTESFIKKLPSIQDTLAVKIALNKPIPELDKDHKHMYRLIERDLYYGSSSDDPLRRPLPKNNKKQQEAVDKALKSRFSLIQGPPGTGKTYTGIKLISLFNKINNIMHKEGKPKKQVLFCGPSNKSVDLVADWMLRRMGNYCPNFVRVYGRSIEALDFPIPGRTFLSKRSTRNQKTSPVLYPVALHHIIRQKGKKYAEEITYLDKLFKDNDYQPMPEKVKRYVHIIREASIDEIRQRDVILCTTAVGSNPKVLEATRVHQVIVDEAGMCPEPQCLVPIIATKAEQVVLIGDHKQLRPIIMCKEAGLLGLETSLFERYAMTKSSKNVEFTMLEEQYRMHPQICYFPSKQFYEGKLITRSGPWVHNPMHIWPEGDWGPYPHIFVHVEGEEKMLTVSTEDGNEQSKSNEAEIEQVVKVLKYFTLERPMDSIQIMSQYNAQVSEIKRKLREEGFVDENITTVVSSQGGEWDYVIFSTVRSLPEYKIENNPTFGWCKHNLGFITDQNQVNVALTRARKGMVIIGNKNLLQCDRVWKKLLQQYEERGCIKTPENFPPKKVSTRQQRMMRNIEESERRYGESMFIKGQATSYEGTFDEVPRRRGNRRRPETFE